MSSSQIAGLGSGIDWQSTIDQLMEIEKRPMQLKQQRKQALDGKSSAWDAINGKLTSLQNTLLTMDTMKEMMIKSVSSTDSEIITATANENATTGSYSVDVLQLANAHKVISSGFLNLSGQIFSGAGTFTIEGKSGHDTPPEPAQSFDVTETTTLSDLKRMINANSDCDFTASIMNDGSASPYRLILTSKETGLNSELHIGGTATLGADFRDISISAAEASTENTGAAVMSSYGNLYTGEADTFTFTALTPTSVEVKNSAGTVISTIDLTGYVAGNRIAVENGMSISFADPATMLAGDIFTINTTDATARDSIIEVENIVITKDTNTITDVIEGVTLTLKDLTEADHPEIINVNNDKEGVKKIVNQFIGDYNTVINTVKGYQRWDDQLKKGGVLFGDGTATSILQDLGMLISSTNAGMNESQLFQTLGQVGIKIGVDGKLSMDNTKFTDALNDNFEETIKLFTIDSNISGTDKSKFQFTSNNMYTQGGNYAMNVTVSGGKITSATIGGEEVKISSNFLTGIKGNKTEGLMMHVDTSVDGTFTADLRFSAGKNQELITQLQRYVETESADGQDGIVPSSKNGLASSIDSINKQIATMQLKLERTRKIMEKKWLAMESYVTEMKNQSARNDAMNG